MITAEFIKKIAPTAKPHVVKDLPRLMNKHLPKYGINNPKRLSLFLANILTETGGFRALEENLNYSAKRLMQVWPGRFPTINSTNGYANNPEALANKVYDRYGNKGKKGYGWRYRGRGFMMTTFVDNYMQVKKHTGMEVVANPNKLLDPEHALVAAALYWQSRGCNELADKNYITECRKRINGGTHGLNHVKGYYKRILPLAAKLNYSRWKKDAGVGAAIGAGGAAVANQTEAINPLLVFLFVGAIVGGIIFYKKQKEKKDVRKTISKTKRMEDVSSELVLDNSGDDYLARAGRVGLPDS